MGTKNSYKLNLGDEKMKKRSLIALIALIVACVMVFAACGGGADKEDEKKDDETTVSTEDTTAAPEVDDTTAAPEVETPAEKTDAEKVADYVALKGTTIISMFESGFTSSGMSCTSTIEAVDTGIVLKICINDLVDIPEEQKAMLQSTFDQSAAALSGNFAPIQAEIPELTYVKFDFCEKDGDLIATFTIDGSEAEKPETDAPATSAGSVVYQMTDEEEGVVAYNFIYDANGNVTEVDYAMVTTPEMTESQEAIEAFEQVYGAFEQLKNAGCNVTVEYGVVDGVRALEAKIMVTGEMEVSFISSILEANFTGATIKLADAEAAAKAQGYTLFEG